MVISLKEILAKRFKNHPVLGEAFIEKMIGDNWPEIAGPKLAEAAWPLFLRKGLLKLAVASAPWHQEINLTKEKLLGNINAFFKKKLVKEIRCEVLSEKELGQLKKASAGQEEKMLGDGLYNPPDSRINLKSFLERLVLMDKKFKKWRERGGAKVCPLCEALFFGGRRFCPACLAQEKDRGFKKIIQLIRKFPQKNYSQLKAIWPGLKRPDFRAGREYWLAEGEKIVNTLRKESASQKRIEPYWEKIKLYLVLKTGLSLEEIKPNLLKKILSDKIYYHLSQKFLKKGKKQNVSSV